MEYRFSRIYCGPVKGVVLDWAGTISDYGCCAPAAVFIEVFKREGVEISMAQAREPMGAHKRDHIAQIAAMPGVAAKWQAAHGAPPAEADITRMYEAFIPLQIDALSGYSDLIPGAIEAVEALRARGIKIGSSSGYNREMMDVVTAEAKQRGFEADTVVSASEVPQGRPAPWLMFRNAELLGVYPMEAMVKIGDTVPDIAAGLNAGAWTIGLAVTGNEVGLNEKDLAALDSAGREALRARAYKRLAEAGAHYVVDGIHETPGVIEEINLRLARGERP